MSKSPLTIVLCYQTEPHHVRQIEALVPDAHVIDAGQERIAEAILEADIYFGHAKVPVPWDQVVEKGKLKWIQSSAAGMDHCLVSEVIGSDIQVSSASGVFANQVAEQTLALLLGLTRCLPTFFRQQQRKEYIRRPTGDLHGKTVGIVGMGGNGRRIAEVLKPFQTRILGTDLFPYDQPLSVDELWSADKLPQLLSDSDIVILALPLNSETYHLFNETRFNEMRDGAIFINVARGQVVKEADLVAALQCGKLSAAGIDVAEVEPLPEKSPLWEMENVMITPHVGAQSASRNDDATNLFCENLEHYLRNEPLINLVDKHLGFPKRSRPIEANS